MSPQSLICIVGYAATAVAVLILTGAPPHGLAPMVAILGGVPLGFYCAKLDSEGR